MRVNRRVLVVASMCLLSLGPSAVVSAQSLDQAAAESILGPQWKSFSRRSGMIFTGTALAAPVETVAIDRPVLGLISSVQVRFRVDEPIAGVERGQILTIREWAGASSTLRSMIVGEHVLLFLYPLSRFGLTSPVGGSLGQVRLDSDGRWVSKNEFRRRREVFRRSSLPDSVSEIQSISAEQLARAIRAAREER